MDFEVKLPILGFENIKNMKLEKIDDIFMRLTNSDEPTPTFMLINPFVLRSYELEVPDAVKIILDLKENTNLLILNIMITHTPIEQSTINFVAPLLFNFDSKGMGQVVLDSIKYPEYGLTEPISKYLQNG